MKNRRGDLPPSKFWATFGVSLAAYSRARRGVKPKNSSNIRSDIFIPVVVIPECINLKPSSWNPARGFSLNKGFLAVWNRIDTSVLFPGFDRRWVAVGSLGLPDFPRAGDKGMTRLIHLRLLRISTPPGDSVRLSSRRRLNSRVLLKTSSNSVQQWICLTGISSIN